jgi:Putative transposase
MTLQQPEFLRRFCLHILPPRFVKIRHFGILANRHRSANITQARALLAEIPAKPEPVPTFITTLRHLEATPLICPHCGHPALILIRVIDRPKGPPTLDSS